MKIKITPFINLVNTLELTDLGDIENLKTEYFKEDLDIDVLNAELDSISEYLQQDIDFWSSIKINRWGILCLNTCTSKTGDFWYANYLRIGSDFEEYILSDTDVSFITYYEEEIDKIEDERLYTVMYHLMCEIIHTPETLKILSANNELFKLLYPHLTGTEITIIINMNRIRIEKGEPVNDYLAEILGGENGN